MAREYNVYININIRSQQFTHGIKNVENSMTGLNRTIGRLTRSFTAFAALFVARKILRGITDLTKRTGELQYQMLQISRTSGITGQELDSLRTSLLRMSIDMAAGTEELAALAVTAGRAGIKTKEGMLEIARVASMMGNVTDLSAEEAATALLKLSAALKLPLSQAQNLASSIVALGKNFTATEAQIAQATLRMIGAGGALGFTASQMMALSAVTIELGLNANRAGTIWQRAMVQLVKNADKAAQVVGVDFIEFKNILDKDVLSGLLLLLKKLDEIPSRSEKLRKMAEIFQLVGLRGVAPVANNLEKLIKALEISQNAFTQGTEITKDYNKILEAFNLTAKRVGDAFSALGIIITTKVLPHIEKFLKQILVLASNNKFLKEATEYFGLIGKRIGEIFTVLQPLLNIIGEALKRIIMGAGLVITGFFDVSQTIAASISLVWETLLKGYRKVIEVLAKLPDKLGGDKFKKALTAVNKEIAVTEETTNNLGKASEFASRQFYEMVEAMKSGSVEAKEALDEIVPTDPSGGEGEESSGGIFAGIADRFEEEFARINDVSKNVAEAVFNAWSTTWQGIESAISNAIQEMVLKGKSFREAMEGMWEAIKVAAVKAVADMIAQLLVWFAQFLITQALMVPPLVAMAKTIELAWAGAAANVSLATLGGNAIPAAAGIASTHALTRGMAAIPMQEGGIVPGFGRGDRIPTLLEPGELVIPRDQVGNVMNNNQKVNVSVSMAGAMVMDNPIAVEKLYREYLRDRIRDDIRTKRDVFYG